MKPSELMLKGFAMAGGRKCNGQPYTGNPLCPTAVCAIGALRLAENGSADIGGHRQEMRARGAWNRLFNEYLWVANDEGMSIPDIAGILAAEGL